MKIHLMQYSDITTLVTAIRICHDSIDKADSYDKAGLGEKDKQLIKNIIKRGHESTLEHIVYTFYINGISRGCLQELVRHRIASYSVQSTRYTLGKIIEQSEDFVNDEYLNWYTDVLQKYCVLTSNDYVNCAVAYQMQAIKDVLSTQEDEQNTKIPNDQLKYMLPEAFKTKLVMTINARSLRNLLKLRLSKKAHWEIRNLAVILKNLIPDEHKILFNDIE